MRNWMSQFIWCWCCVGIVTIGGRAVGSGAGGGSVMVALSYP